MSYTLFHWPYVARDSTANWRAFRQSDDGTTWSLEQSRTANTVNELTAINATVGEQWADPKYDANGNMTTIPRPGLNRPSLANLTTAQWSALTVNDWSRMEVAPTLRATYDAWNRLVKLTDGGNGETIQENHYDGRGYRIVTKTYADGTLDETRHAYFTDQWQCIEERLDTSTTPDRHFIWGFRYIDDLILRDRSVSGGTLNERLYALQDANWNVVAVADSNGEVQERYEYDPYGETIVLAPSFTVRTASASKWETTYCGYRYDSSLRLYSVRERFYSCRVGAWLSRDPVQYMSGLNLFEYVSSTPLDLVDPSGLSSFFFLETLAPAPIEILAPRPLPLLQPLPAPPATTPFTPAPPVPLMTRPPIPGPSTGSSTTPAPATKPLPQPQLPNSPGLSRVRTGRRTNGCPAKGDYECHHLIPQTFWNSSAYWGYRMPSSFRNDCRNLCCIPRADHMLTFGNQSSWYPNLVNNLIMSTCGRRPTVSCLATVAAGNRSQIRLS